MSGTSGKRGGGGVSVCVGRSNGSQIGSEKQVYDVRTGSERIERRFECFASWIYGGCLLAVFVLVVERSREIEPKDELDVWKGKFACCCAKATADDGGGDRRQGQHGEEPQGLLWIMR
jgi:hypothetical protein